MLSRIVKAAVLTGLFAATVPSGAQAQQPANAGQQIVTPSGWTFNVAPYAWLASLNVTSNFNLPPAVGGTLSASSSLGFGDVLSHMNSALMIAGGAQYDRFSLLTDFIYMNLGGANSRFRSIDFPNRPSLPISGAVQGSVGMNLNAKIWTLAGGYTVVQGDWGNLDVIAGFRYLDVPVSMDYNLALTLTGPRGRGATFGGVGSVSGTAAIWNGIGGFRGRIYLGDTALFIPYYFDAGAGGSKLTWQIASGFAYQTSWGDVSLTYRYLSFEQGSGAVRHLSANGPMIMANFTF